MNGKQVLSILKAHGWSLLRINGSHHVMGKDGARVPVPVHGTKDIKPGTLANIARVTGITFK